MIGDKYGLFMKKQRLYGAFVPRMFATMMDLCLVSILLMPITNIINRKVITKKFGAIFEAKHIDIDDTNAVREALQSIEFAPYSNLATVIEIMLPMLCVQLIVMMLYFVLCWNIWGATPVKYIMRMRVVDVVSLNKPTIFQSIRRFIGYMFFPIGIWSIFFTTQKQMLHDKISSTMVIKA